MAARPVSRLILACVVVGATCAIAVAQPQPKKLIEYGWDVPTPSFVAAHIREMEKLPFDGLIMRVPNIGSVFVNQKWEQAKVQGEFDALGRIQWGQFTDNFIIMYAASQMDWFSDADWECVLHNARLCAKAAKVGRCKGVCFDYEPYGSNPWQWSAQPRAKEKTFAEYQVVVRQRGAQFMDTLQREYPGLVMHTFFQLGHLSSAATEPDEAVRMRKLSQDGYGLLAAFVNGMLDVAAPGVILTDGNESSYYYTDPLAYFKSFHGIRQTALGLVAPENRTKYLAQVQCAQALYVDYVFSLWSRSTPSTMMAPEQRAKWFEHNVYWALTSSDRYVWLYSEKMNWWTNKDLPPGLTAATAAAREKVAKRQPLGFDLAPIIKQAREAEAAKIRAKLGDRVAQVTRAQGGIAAPVIDGRLDDPIWKQAPAMEPFAPYASGDNDTAKAATLAWAAYDDKYLYIAVRCAEPKMDKLSILGVGRDDDVWQGDSVDIFLAPGKEPTPFYHMILNPRNVLWDAFQQADTEIDLGWSPAIQSATTPGTDHWSLELAVPWSALKVSAPAAGARLHANICRARSADEREYTSWSRCIGGFQEPDRFGTWVLK